MELSIIQLILTYGPDAVTLVENLVKQFESSGQLTIADVQAEFAPLKPYAVYGIPNAVVTATPLKPSTTPECEERLPHTDHTPGAQPACQRDATGREGDDG